MHGDVIAHIHLVSTLTVAGCEQSAPRKQETPGSVLVKARGLRAKPGFWQGGAYPYTCDEPALASWQAVMVSSSEHTSSSVKVSCLWSLLHQLLACGQCTCAHPPAICKALPGSALLP